MKSDNNMDIFRDDPRRRAQEFRWAAESSLLQFPNDAERYQHYLHEAERIEASIA